MLRYIHSFTMVEESFEIWWWWNAPKWLLHVALIVFDWKYHIEIILIKKPKKGDFLLKRRPKGDLFWGKVFYGDSSLLKETYLGMLQLQKISFCIFCPKIVPEKSQNLKNPSKHILVNWMNLSQKRISQFFYLRSFNNKDRICHISCTKPTSIP